MNDDVKHLTFGVGELINASNCPRQGQVTIYEALPSGVYTFPQGADTPQEAVGKPLVEMTFANREAYNLLIERILAARDAAYPPEGRSVKTPIHETKIEYMLAPLEAGEDETSIREAGYLPLFDRRGGLNVLVGKAYVSNFVTPNHRSGEAPEAVIPIAAIRVVSAWIRTL